MWEWEAISDVLIEVYRIFKTKKYLTVVKCHYKYKILWYSSFTYHSKNAHFCYVKFLLKIKLILTIDNHDFTFNCLIIKYLSIVWSNWITTFKISEIDFFPLHKSFQNMNIQLCQQISVYASLNLHESLFSPIIHKSQGNNQSLDWNLLIL